MTHGCKYFKLEEIFHPSFFDVTPDLWGLRDQRIWSKLDQLREGWGKPIWINKPDIKLFNAGVRPMDSKVGAPKSRHKLILPDVQALDLHGKDLYETHSLYQYCCTHWYEYNIHRIEDYMHTKAWVHIEIGIDPPQQMRIFVP